MVANRIPDEIKEQGKMRLLPPYSWSLRQIATDLGVGVSTVSNWRKELELEGLFVPKQEPSDNWSAEQIFSIVLETATLSEHQLAEYCREQGLFVDQVKAWKQNCIHANQSEKARQNQLVKENRSDQKRIKCLEKELKRKDKALAETAALLVLREKCNALWEEKEET